MNNQVGKEVFGLMLGFVLLVGVGCSGFKNIEESGAELSNNATTFSLDLSKSLNVAAGGLPPAFAGQKIFEMVTAGGFRPDCYGGSEHLGDPSLCIKASGYRIFSEGRIVKFAIDRNGVEVQYEAGRFAQDVMQALFHRINGVYARGAPVVDLNEGAPICMDAPRVTLSLFFDRALAQQIESGEAADMQEIFELGRIENCHRFARAEDPEALLLMEKFLALGREIDQQPKVENRVVIEKSIQYGFRPDPLSSPESVLIQVFEDGRMIKVETFLDSARNLKTELGYLVPDKLMTMKDLIQRLSGAGLNLEDEQKDQPLCQDAPSLKYSFVHESSAGSKKEAFFELRNCHAFSDVRFQLQSTELVKILDSIQ